MVEVLLLAVVVATLVLYVIIRVLQGRQAAQQHQEHHESVPPGDATLTERLTHTHWYAECPPPLTKPFDGLATALGTSTELTEQMSLLWSDHGENRVVLEYASTQQHAWEITLTRGQGDRINRVLWRLSDYRTTAGVATELAAMNATLTAIHDYYTARGATVTTE